MKSFRSFLITESYHKQHRVFVYQTLRNIHTLAKVLGKKKPEHYAILPDWSEKDRGGGYHTIVKSKGDRVEGDLFYVTDDELLKLDKWEDRYERETVKLKDGKEAFVYIMKES